MKVLVTVVFDHGGNIMARAAVIRSDAGSHSDDLLSADDRLALNVLTFLNDCERVGTIKRQTVTLLPS